jgi:signal transduction histidine kinase
MNRLQQVLLNLLTNANKFCKGGNINIYCKYKKDYNQLFFTVVDEGIGINPDDRKRLF